jgi:hypothetical protein
MENIGVYTTDRPIELLGCTVEFFKQYIVGKFLPGMTFENYGRGRDRNGHDRWQLDHIIALNSFDLRDPKQQEKAFHYTNYQPLWQQANLHKSDKLNWSYEEYLKEKGLNNP